MPREKGKEKDILDAAAKVFCERGFASANMQDIAQCAGIGKGTIYEYFKSKEELFIKVLLCGVEDYLCTLKEQLAAEGQFEGKLNAFIAANQTVIEGNIKQMQFMMRNHFVNLKPETKAVFKKTLKSLRAEIVSLLVQILEQGEAEKKLRPLDKEFAADIFFDMVIRCCNRFAIGPCSEAQKEEEKAKLVDLFLRGVGGN